MMAKSATAAPAGEWLYEIKLDGFRALALLGPRDSKLVSRSDHDFAERFPEIVAALAAFPVRDSILDGEVVALAPDGRSSFELLGARATKAPLVYYVFDVLRLAGRDVTHLPLEDRKLLVASALAQQSSPCIRFCDSISSDASTLLAHAKTLGLEGLIGKRSGSRYEVGKRTGAWIKLKLITEQDFVIGGFTRPEGSRAHLGALLVGSYVGGALHFVAAVGSGYTERSLAELGEALRELADSECPFGNLPEKSTRGRTSRMTRAEMSRCHWVRPDLVCQVRFTAWTADGHLRQPVFLGLRADQDPRAVIREP